MAASFEQTYPNITDWVMNGYGWIEIGADHHSRSLIRVLDFGGLVWDSGDREYKTLDQALAGAEAAIVKWRKEQGI